ncbi:class I SAM-dependent methyltransferase [Acinetobacter nectaris]|uniref:class I SAM-dependent methyltransferase n=1 Tax=Acinetobacter nectaris TaxID=1219382 RepID=UPI001F365122|nr:class I SAM-dependent methyltransferase [Acinetobacter nectaris]MCF8999986.1 class I SAM-dependent methyltransferase [Acinetobacter nectaris]MCF9028367.1 class I SAM-dependent methyltransferase [Acinetobacter nectaris]
MQKSFAEQTLYMRHRPVLEVVLGYLNNNLPKVAIDCGCGAGNEVQFLLEQGFTVYAFDQSKQAEEICRTRFKYANRFIFSNNSFHDYPFVEASLITAFFSLFFVPEKQFFDVLENIKKALPKNGILACNLLGINDAWVEESPHVFLGFNEQQLKDLFSEYFDIVYLDHLQEERPLASGLIKFWDIFTVILKKK